MPVCLLCVSCICRPLPTRCVHSCACLCVYLYVPACLCLCLCRRICAIWLTSHPCQQDVAHGPWAPTAKKKEKKTTFIGHSVLKSGCTVDNKLAPSCLPLQMLRLGFNCGTWVGKQQHYRQNSNARVSGRVVNSSHNTSVYTVDTEPATFAPLPCSHWIRIWHKFCTYKISKCHCSRS